MLGQLEGFLCNLPIMSVGQRIPGTIQSAERQPPAADFIVPLDTGGVGSYQSVQVNVRSIDQLPVPISTADTWCVQQKSSMSENGISSVQVLMASLIGNPPLYGSCKNGQHRCVQRCCQEKRRQREIECFDVLNLPRDRSKLSYSPSSCWFEWPVPLRKEDICD